MGKCCESKVLCWEKEAESTSAPELCSFHGPAAFSFPLVMAALRGCRHGTMPDEPPAAWLASPFPWDTWLRAGPQGFPPSGPFASWQPNFFLLAFLASLSVVLSLRRKPRVSVAGLRTKRVSCSCRNVPVPFQGARAMPNGTELLFDLIL